LGCGFRVLPVVGRSADRDPRGVHRLRTAALAVLVLASLPAAAGAQSDSRQSATLLFTESRPGESSGVRLAIDYVNPSNPESKPPAVQKVVTRLQPGATMDTSAPARCEASDAVLIANGASACPAASKVGGGEVDVDTGLPGPGRILQNDLIVLNNKDELILLLERKTDPRTRSVVRGKVEGTAITSEVPPIPGGPPDGFAAVKRVRLSLDRQSGYVTTPRQCPASGSWTNTATFTYRDGVSQTVSNPSPCTGTSARGDYRGDHKPPRIRMAGAPRKRCAHSDFRARVRIAERWSGLRRAQLSLGRRRLLVTRSKRFSRRIPAGRLRSRRHRLTVVAIDNAGNRSVKAVAFHRCRTA
jgi:hypothetical protein